MTRAELERMESLEARLLELERLYSAHRREYLQHDDEHLQLADSLCELLVEHGKPWLSFVPPKEDPPAAEAHVAQPALEVKAP